MSAFQYSEALFCKKLGVDRRDMRALRRSLLREGRDFKKTGNNDLLLTEGAVKYAAKYFKAPDPDLTTLLPEEKNGDTVAEPELKTLRVIPPRPFNPRVVHARDEAGEVWVVDVGRNDNFVFDDEIKAGPHETQQGILQLRSEVPRNRRRV